MVFDNIVELNKDEDLTSGSGTHLEFEISKDISSIDYIGNHKILWKKNRKIILTLGPHCKKINKIFKTNFFKGHFFYLCSHYCLVGG